MKNHTPLKFGLIALVLVFGIAATPFFNVFGLDEAEAYSPLFDNRFPTTTNGNTQSSIVIESFKENLTYDTNVLALRQEPNTANIYVLEQTGLLSVIDKNEEEPEKKVFRDMRDIVYSQNESGLLGIAFHPEFNETNSVNANYIYLYYSKKGVGVTNMMLTRVTRDPITNSFLEGSEITLIEQNLDPSKRISHLGGGLEFGNDGFLYLTIGDLYNPSLAQNITDRFVSGVLRIDVDKKGGSISHPIIRGLQQLNIGTSDNYYIPNDNPWVNSDGSVFEEFYAIGCRNPHAMSIDAETGTMFIGDVGSNSGTKYEEVNILEKGANYGWPFREGETDRPDLSEVPDPIIGNLTDPMHFYGHTGGSRSVIGGYVYYGTNFPELKGKYIFGDWGSNSIWSMNVDGSDKELIGTINSRITTLGQDTEGEIYIGQVGSNKAILKLEVQTDVAIPSGYYFVRSKSSGKLIAVINDDTENVNSIQLADKDESDQQQWYIEEATDTYVTLKNKQSGFVIASNAISVTNEAQITQEINSNSNHQKWKLEIADDGYYKIVNFDTGLYLQETDSSNENSGLIHTSAAQDIDSQLWDFVPIDAIPTTPPRFLSEAGIFSDLENLIPVSGIMPYTVNTPLWSDGSEKLRWIALPNDGNFSDLSEQIQLDSDNLWVNNESRGQWAFPAGTMLIKHFALALNKKKPKDLHRLETRFMILNGDGTYYGVTYRWNESQTDAEILYDGLEEDFKVELVDGRNVSQTWSYPSSSQCINCHTVASGGVLGPQTSQINGDYTYQKTGRTANQLGTWNFLNIFDKSLIDNEIDNLITSRNIADESASVEQRVRSYLDANCASCHQPDGGPRSTFDFRIETNLDAQNIINGEVISNYGITDGKVIVPGSPEKSVLYHLINQANTSEAMPPLGKNMVDVDAVNLIRDWINALNPDGNGWIANYFYDDSLEDLAFTRIDKAVDFNWDENTAEEDFDSTFYSVRWEGALTTRFSEAYTFSLLSDDGVRMWVDGQLIIDEFSSDGLTEKQGVLNLSEGEHSVKIEYHQEQDEARVHLFWESTSQSRELVPAMYVRPEVLPSTDLGMNLAFQKPTQQSTNYHRGGEASLAVDGDTNGVWRNGSVSHTAKKGSSQPWWRVDLEDIYDISDIAIFNRTDCCADRLTGAKVFVSTIDSTDPKDYIEVATLTSNQEQNLSNLSATGRYVLVHLEGNYEILSLAEVQVFGKKTNLAFQKPTLQSTNYRRGGASSLAVDGDTNGVWNNGSVSHTAGNGSSQPWWRVDLEGTYDISDIAIFNRTNCCANRLTGAKVFVSTIDSTDPKDYIEVATLTSNQEQNLSDLSITGRYVLVYHEGDHEILSLAEVEVYGTAAETLLSSTTFGIQTPSITIYPNPTTDYITVSETDLSTIINIYDFTGQLVKSTHGGQEIYIGDLVQGNYFISVSNRGTTMLIKQ